MKNLQWTCVQFKQLSNYQLYELLKLRVNIFVVEQNCPYPELDDKDEHSETRHLCAYHNSKLVAYARLLAPGLSYTEASIGRFAVDASIRKQGLGTLLLLKSLEEINRIWPEHGIRISAQEYLKEFYEKFGFMVVSDSYFEDDIAHVAMLKKSTKT